MKIREMTGWLVFVCMLSLCLEAQQVNKRTVQVGPQKQLFIDDYVIADMSGIEKVLNSPERHPQNLLVLPDQPWEGGGVVPSPVLFEPEAEFYHMYYAAFYNDKVYYNCYARSVDGLQWEKPSLGIYAGPDGTRNNNIVLRGEGKKARPRYVYLDPGPATTQRKFAMLYCDNAPGLRDYVAYSSDGLHWTIEASLGICAASMVINRAPAAFSPSRPEVGDGRTRPTIPGYLAYRE